MSFHLNKTWWSSSTPPHWQSWQHHCCLQLCALRADWVVWSSQISWPAKHINRLCQWRNEFHTWMNFIRASLEVLGGGRTNRWDLGFAWCSVIDNCFMDLTKTLGWRGEKNVPNLAEQLYSLTNIIKDAAWLAMIKKMVNWQKWQAIFLKFFDNAND